MTTVTIGDKCPGCHVRCFSGSVHTDECLYQGADALTLVPPKLNQRERNLLANAARFPRDGYAGTRETNVMPNTVEALVDRGWLEYAPTTVLEREHRLVARKTLLAAELLALQPPA